MSEKFEADYVIIGGGTAGSILTARLASGSNKRVILLERGNKLIVKAIKKSEFLFIAGKPIGEPIARGGPFVMNTKAEILEAIQDYNNGTFAKY